MEQWERWLPLNGLPPQLYNESFIDNKEGVILEFSDESEKRTITVTFDKGVLSYRNTDEGSLIKKLSQLDDQYGVEFYSEWTLFKVRNSSYIDWFLDESSGVYKQDQIVHYVFLTPDDVIEILSSYEPSVMMK